MKERPDTETNGHDVREGYQEDLRNQRPAPGAMN